MLAGFKQLSSGAQTVAPLSIWVATSRADQQKPALLDDFHCMSPLPVETAILRCSGAEVTKLTKAAFLSTSLPLVVQLSPNL